MLKKSTKAFFGALLSIILCAMALVSVSAEAYKQYTVEELQMDVSLPADMYVITRDSQSSEPVFSDLNIDYIGKIAAMQNGNIYLQGIAKDNSLTVEVAMVRDEVSEKVNDFRLLKNDQLDLVLEGYLQLESYSDGCVSEYNDVVFCDLRLQYPVNSTTVYAAQSNTVVNGMNVNITFQSVGDELTDEELKTVQKILKSISFAENDEVNKKKAAVVIWVIVIIAIIILLAILAWYFLNKKKMLSTRPTRVSLERTKQRDNLEEEYGYDSDEFERNSVLLNEKKINVKDGSINGLSYFEDDGKSIDGNSEYFSDYFANGKESKVTPSPKKSVSKTLKNAYTRTGYFVTNVSRLVKKKSKQRNKNKR